MGDVLSECARRRLMGLFPMIGPWTAAALWHGINEVEPPRADLKLEIDVILRSRLAGLLLRYVRHQNIEIPRELALVLQQDAFRRSVHSAAVIRPAAEVIDRLRGAGIECVVSKGPGISITYPAMDARPFADVDILLDPDQFSLARQLLMSDGWGEDEDSRPPRRYFDTLCREATNLRRPPTGSIDIHHRVPPWLWGKKLTVSELIKNRHFIELHGIALPVVAPEDNLLIASLHVVSDHNKAGKSLMVWRDVRQLASAVSPPVAARRARIAGLSAWLRSVLNALPCELRPAALINELGEDGKIPSPGHLAALLSPTADRVGYIGTQFLRLPTQNAFAMLVAFAAPDCAFLQHKYPGVRNPYLHWLRSSTRRAGPPKELA